jgi:hypothetical protein
VLRAYRAEVTSAAVDAGDAAATLTRIAYQFFGHPNLRVADRSDTSDKKVKP